MLPNLREKISKRISNTSYKARIMLSVGITFIIFAFILWLFIFYSIRHAGAITLNKTLLSNAQTIIQTGKIILPEPRANSFIIDKNDRIVDFHKDNKTITSFISTTVKYITTTKIIKDIISSKISKTNNRKDIIGLHISNHPLEYVRESYIQHKKHKKDKKGVMELPYNWDFIHFRYRSLFVRYIGAYIPFEKNGEKFHIVFISMLKEIIKEEYIVQIKIFLAAMFFLILLLLLINYYFQKIFNHLQSVSKEIYKITNFKLEQRIAIKTNIKETRKIFEAISTVKKGFISFTKYVPPYVVRSLLTEKREAKIGGSSQELSIFFADIENFTSIAERMTTENLLRYLDEYLRNMSKTIQMNKGIVDKFIGDAIMAFWSKESQANVNSHALSACQTAIECQIMLSKIRSTTTTIHLETGNKDAFPHTKVRMGISTGEVILGNIGYEDRMNYTVIGNKVNIASRLENLCKEYGTSIIIDEDTNRCVTKQMRTRLLDTVQIRGYSRKMKVFELIGDNKNKISDSDLEFIYRYEQALNYYTDKNYQKAKDDILKLLTLRPKDLSVIKLKNQIDNKVNKD